MTRLYDCHVFAHEDGRYQTTHASTGITSAERAILEQFFFGQTNDEQYLASLAQEPGVIWRRVDGRYALTRVLAGKKDASGRATLQFETLVIPPEALELTDNLAELVRSTWRFSRRGASCTYSGEPHAQQLHADKVSSIVLQFRESKRLVVRSATLSLRDVEKIVSLCRNAPAFSLCYKSLNERAPVAINLVFGNVTETHIMTRTTTPQGHPRPGPVRTVSRRPATTAVFVPIALCLILLIQIITLFVGGSSSDPTPTDRIQEHIITRIEHESRELSNQLRAALAEMSMKFEGASQKLFGLEKQSEALSAELKGLQGDLRNLTDIAWKHDRKWDPAIQNLQDRITEVRVDLGKELKELKEAVEPLEKKLDDLEKGHKDILEKITAMTPPVGPEEGGENRSGEGR